MLIGTPGLHEIALEMGNPPRTRTTLTDLPLDVIEIITDMLACDYWESAAQITDHPRFACKDSMCATHPGAILFSPVTTGSKNPARLHYHSPDPAHVRNIKLAAMHQIDSSIAPEVSPWLWNSWVINLSSVTRLIRAEIFDGKVMDTFYLPALDIRYVERAKNIFGKKRLASVQNVFIGSQMQYYYSDGLPDYFPEAFPAVQNIRRQWNEGSSYSRARLAGSGRRAWLWMNLPGLRLRSLDIQLFGSQLDAVRTPRDPRRRHGEVPLLAPTPPMSVEKLVIRGISRPWLLPHRTFMANVLVNYRDIQELVLDFQLPVIFLTPRLDLGDVFPQLTPTRLRDCTKLTFRFVPPTTNNTMSHGYLEFIIRNVVERFGNIEHIKIVLRTDDLVRQTNFPFLNTEHVPTRQQLEVFTQQEAVALADLQTVECLYVDRMRPMDPPVMQFLARVRRDEENPATPKVHVERAFWDTTRMAGFAENGARLILL